MDVCHAILRADPRHLDPASKIAHDRQHCATRCMADHGAACTWRLVHICRGDVHGEGRGLRAEPGRAHAHSEKSSRNMSNHLNPLPFPGSAQMPAAPAPSATRENTNLTPQ